DGEDPAQVTGYTLSSDEVTINGETVSLDNQTEFATKEEALAAFADAVKEYGVKVEVDADDADQINFVSDKAFNVDTDEDEEVVSGETIDGLKVNTDEETSGGILTQADAEKAITSINNAIESVSAERSKLGAYQNRLEHTINNLGASAENLTAAESR